MLSLRSGLKPYTDGTGVGVGIQSRSPVRVAAVHRRCSKFRILKMSVSPRLLSHSGLHQP
eukprot:6242487-Prymnesium_polylepis.3